SGDPQRAVAYLEKRRQPYRPETELAVARAYRSVDQRDKAAEILRRLYYESPLSPEADAAAIELHSLGEAQPVGTFEQRHLRAEMILKGKRYRDAVGELSALMEQAPAEKLADLQLDFAAALYHDRKRDDAQRLCESIVDSASANLTQKAQALYFLAELAREKE